MSNESQYLENLLEDELLIGFNEILLYNDDYNTFEHVIEMLCKYCSHDSVQAEQCAWIVHNNGKCMVKRGDMNDLKPICSALREAGLSAKIL
jgi:ATP-dependent Clp protease adaptor protein ClpS